jgi:hypothetical protein
MSECSNEMFERLKKDIENPMNMESVKNQYNWLEILDKTKKSSEIFKATVLAELQRRANEDPLFGKNFAKEGKNIDDCITYYDLEPITIEQI